MIGLIAVTANGRRNACHLDEVWDDARIYGGKPKEALQRAWEECEGIVLFLAAGAAVRLIAPLLDDKFRDPGIVSVDDAGRFAVSLTGGHGGGANELAGRVAESLGATPVVTTASDSLVIPALDRLGEDLGFRVQEGSDIAAVGAALLSGEPVHLVSDRRWPLGPLPPNVIPSKEMVPPLILITDRLLDPPHPAVVYRPPSLAIGVGCSRGASSGEILELIDSSLLRAGLSGGSVAHLATIDLKFDEAGLLEAAEQRGWPVHFYSSAELSTVGVPNPSSTVQEAVGTPSVAEAAALMQGGELILQKRKSGKVTAAIGRPPVRGRLALVSLGPGDESLIPPLARDALASSQLVIGLAQYVDRVLYLLRPGTEVRTLPLGEEVERARVALEEARDGRSVALVSGGDVGVYAMASPALEAAGGDVDVVVVPGVTAAQAAAALLGAPLGHDHCSISLSDLLTPWELILERVEAAARTDFVISLYNPRSKGRDWQLGEVKDILLKHRSPETPVGTVRDAYRPTQKTVITTLAELRPEDVDMLTVVIVGSSQTVVRAGRMVTPRGYLG